MPGLYLVADGLGRPCGRLPIRLSVCPCCGNGIKPARGWTWINGTALIADQPCSLAGSPECASCRLASPPGRVGLLWIGERYYPSPQDFCAEADRMGVSRRIPAIPRDFELGETWVWLAHRKCIEEPDGSWSPGVFRVFKPQRIEGVVRGDEDEDEIARMVDRGITPVQVIRDVDQCPLIDGASP